MATILVIDDDPAVRLLIARILGKAGHQVIEAEQGAIGLAMYRQRQADLVITDLIMPEMEGIETVRALRALAPDLPIITMSGGDRTGHSYLTATKELGASATLQKPFRTAELLETVGRLCPPRAP